MTFKYYYGNDFDLRWSQRSQGFLGHTLKTFAIQIVPNLQWFDLQIFDFMMVQTRDAFNRNCCEF